MVSTISVRIRSVFIPSHARLVYATISLSQRSCMSNESFKSLLQYQMYFEPVNHSQEFGTNCENRSSFIEFYRAAVLYNYKTGKISTEIKIIGRVRLHLPAVPFRRNNSVFLSQQISISISYFSSQPNSSVASV